jgi:hypothetical protein
MMMFLFLFLITAQETSDFVCNPPHAIKDRVNEHCIQATQYSITYAKPQVRKIKNGKLFITSKETDDGSVVLKMAHKCRGKKITEWKTFEPFCGYEIITLDRQTPAIREMRQALAETHGLNEYMHRNQIDRLMAQQINPWIADPLKNIFEKNGNVKVKTLKNRLDATCHTPLELIYETNCK